MITSKTIKFNVYQLLGTIALLLGAYTVMPGLPDIVYPILGFSSMLVSEIITYTNPSGGWAFSSGDWTAGKWVYRVGNSLLIIFAYMKGQGWAMQVIALSTPLIEIFIRRYGSGTEIQKIASANKSK
jgi:hypothetical protein